MSIELFGAQTNNLKNIDVSFPEGKITVVTGVSGSGKSSLVFDTLYSESYRRYVESLSSFARQYLKALPKAKLASVKNLPPSIAVKQTKSGSNNRSTVATITEMHDLLRVLYTHIAEIQCYSCGRVVRKDNSHAIVSHLMRDYNDRSFLIMSPMKQWAKLNFSELKDQLLSQGFVRLWSKQSGIEKIAELKKINFDTYFVVVDRVKIESSSKNRFLTSVDLSFRLGRGNSALYLEVESKGEKTNSGSGQIFLYSSILSCPHCDILYPEPSAALFSFNHPLGACTCCQGFGQAQEVDFDKVLPDRDSALADKGVVAWNFGSHVSMYSDARRSAEKLKLDILEKNFENYSVEEWDWLKNGDGKSFVGISGYFKWLDEHRHKTHYRIHAARFRKYVTCPICLGQRLKKEALSFRIKGLNIAELSSLSIQKVFDWILDIKSQVFTDVTSYQNSIEAMQESLEELVLRLTYLKKVGLSYLCLDRSTKTISGGEMQRISMARCLSGALVDTLYCLDEPSSGLHARDSQRLLEVVRELKDQGNTVVLVEHERVMIDGADHLIEIGPDAGHKGGYQIFKGKPSERAKEKQSSMGIVWEFSNKSFSGSFLELRGAKTHNLKNISVKFPLEAFSVVCGVSGSGKTSLIQHTLYPLLAKELGSDVEGYVAQPIAKEILPRELSKKLGFIVHVSQTAMGRSTRSNIASYLGLLDDIRKIFSQQPRAKDWALTPGHFSFNTDGGRCEQCRGLGTVIEDLSFLGEMAVICSACNGRRFNDRVLSVEFKGKSFMDVLELTVAEAREFFFEQKSIAKALDEVLALGLGYISLGQNTSSFSGGEAQRLKLLRLMKDQKKSDKKGILIFDEPSTGLSDRDVFKLVEQFKYLCNMGHTVIVVEHHLGIIKSADWVVEIGPESADDGGELVFQGAPRDLIDTSTSRTAPFIK